MPNLLSRSAASAVLTGFMCVTAGCVVVTTGGGSSTPSNSASGVSTTPVSASTPSPSKASSSGGRIVHGSSVKFENFEVKVQDAKRVSDGEFAIKAKVCVLSLPDNPSGNRTRISRDPWSVVSAKGSAKADSGVSKAGPGFPVESLYRVGSCAQGWIPFVAPGAIRSVIYKNGVGDKAVWDADNLDKKPVSSTSMSKEAADSAIGEGTYLVGDDVRPGRYKARARSGMTCYWARLRDDSGDSDSIISNGITSGAASVTIKPSDSAFETSGCTRWTRRS